MHKKIIIFCAILFCVAGPLFADSNDSYISVSSHISAKEANLGDVLTFSVEIEHSPSIQTFPPVKTGKLGGFEILDYAKKQITNEYGNIVQNVSLKLAAYSLGSKDIPALDIVSIDSDGRSNIIKTEAVSVFIEELNPKGFETNEAKDIESQQELSITEKPHELVIIISILALISAAAFFIAGMNKKKKEIEKQKPIPEDEEALAAIEELRSKSLIENREFTEFYFALTSIFRRYISRRFSLSILEMTSQEAAKTITDKDIPDAQNAAGFLQKSDIIKYAKGETEAEDAQRDIQYCVDYIQGHKSLEAEIKEKEKTQKKKEAESKSSESKE